MSSVLVSSQCQCADVVVPNLSPITSATSKRCTFPGGRVPLKQTFGSGHGLSKTSTLQSQSRASQFERFDDKVNYWFFSFSSFSSSGCSRFCWTGSLCPGAGSRGSRGGVFRAVDASSCGDSSEMCVGFAVPEVQRRELVRVLSSWIVLPGLLNAGSAFGAAAAEDDEQSSESSPTTAPPAKTLVERLLERSKANKAKYDQERLDAYYRRNFKDYFEFLKGTIQNKDKDKLTEADKGILQWLEKNQ